MDKKTLISLVLVIFIGLISVIIFNNLKSKNIEVVNERDQAINSILEKPQITLNTKHQYKDGVHTYIGTFETPTPCYTHNATVEYIDGQRAINITYEPESGVDSCIAVIDTKTFRVSFEGDESESVVATLNGDLVNLNIFEVPENQDIDSFEIFIKG